MELLKWIFKEQMCMLKVYNCAQIHPVYCKEATALWPSQPLTGTGAVLELVSLQLLESIIWESILSDDHDDHTDDLTM